MSRYELKTDWGPSPEERMREKFKSYFGALDFVKNDLKTAPGYVEYYLYMPEHKILTPDELRFVFKDHVPGGGMIGLKQRGVPQNMPIWAYIWQKNWYWKRKYKKGVGKID